MRAWQAPLIQQKRPLTQLGEKVDPTRELTAVYVYRGKRAQRAVRMLADG